MQKELKQIITKDCVITDVREKQILNSKVIKSTWFTNLTTSKAERERIFYYEKNQNTERIRLIFVV